MGSQIAQFLIKLMGKTFYSTLNHNNMRRDYFCFRTFYGSIFSSKHGLIILWGLKLDKLSSKVISYPQSFGFFFNYFRKAIIKPNMTKIMETSQSLMTILGSSQPMC